MAVIEGDIQSTRDAERIAAKGVAAVQINTDGACHLDGNMIRDALGNFNLSELDLLVVENVGNLVCPVDFRLGERLNVVVASVPEGDDKPFKYPGIFLAVDAVVINKIDLLPYVRFDLEAFRRQVQGMNPEVSIFEVSCETGQGVEDWAEWVAQRAAQESAG